MKTRRNPRPRNLEGSALAEWIKTQCVVTESGCWEWQGYRFGPPPRHYGVVAYHRADWRVHRLIWFLAHGEIPEGIIVMHRCDNPPCCNLDHLKLGTHLENMADCRAKDRYHYANQTHCKRGHEFTPENTYIIPTPGEQFGLRHCRQCDMGRQRVAKGWDPELAYSTPSMRPGRRRA